MSDKHPVTPRSTPRTDSELDDSESSSGSSQHTERQSSPPIMTSENNVLIIGTLNQRQAAAINAILSKINIKKPLDSNNWSSWTDGISLGLAGAMFDDYLLSDDLPGGEDQNLHRVIKKCIVTWILSNMNQTESDRALGFITTFDSQGQKMIDYKPALVWKKMREYHASQSIYKRMALRDSLDQLKQGQSRDLLKHIDEWQLKLKNLLEAQETMMEEEKCSRLARSLNPKWREKATDYMDLGFNTVDVLIPKLKQAYELLHTINSNSAGPSHPPHHSHSHRADDDGYEYEGD